MIIFINGLILNASLPEKKIEDQTEFKKITVPSGSAFSTIMQGIGVSYKESLTIVEASKQLFNFNKLKPGQVIYYKKSGKSYPILDELRIEVGKKEVRYSSTEQRALLTGKEIMITSTFIKERVDSLRDSNNKNYNDLLDIFSYRINHERLFKTKDDFVIFYDEYIDEYGSFVKNGSIRYAAFSSGRKVISAYLFKDNYYDANAKPLVTRLFHSPLERNLHVTSGYGWRRHPTRHFRDFHPAVDYRAPHGTAILASANGFIEAKDYDKWLGNHIIIKHENGWRTIYGHFSSYPPQLKKGHRVQAGDVIGYSGSTGVATGAHLHFAIIRGSEPVDPHNFLIIKEATLSLEDESDFFILKNAVDNELKVQTRS